MRGIAALTVLTYHVWVQFSDVPAAGALDAAAFYILTGLNGTAAVVCFFVISGFVLARSLEDNPEPGRYFRNRVFRLFPAAVAVVGLLTVLHHWFGIYVMWEGDFGPGNVFLNMLMIRTDINAVMWSMKVECFATPLILFSAWLVQRDRTGWLWVMIVVLFFLSFWGPYVHALGDATNLVSIIAILSVALCWYSGTRKQTAPILLVECLCAALLVASIAWRPLAIFKPLDLGVVRFYGKISYSFYLLHVLGMLFATRLLGLAKFPISELPISVATVIVTIVSILLITPAAYLSWRFIEIPFVSFGKNIGLRLVQAPLPSQ